MLYKRSKIILLRKLEKMDCIWNTVKDRFLTYKFVCLDFLQFSSQMIFSFKFFPEVLILVNIYFYKLTVLFNYFYFLIFNFCFLNNLIGGSLFMISFRLFFVLIFHFTSVHFYFFYLILNFVTEAFSPAS